MQAVYEEIYQRICTDKSLLPAAPDIGMKILSALNKPNCDIKLVAKIIENDVGLTAFIMKTARSIRYLTSNPPKDLESAVVRMGMRETYHLSIAFLSRAVFNSSNRDVRKYLTEAQKFSTKLAVISYFLAGNVSRIPPSQALLAGLFQDIGVPAVLAALEKHPEILTDEKYRSNCVDSLAIKVGVLILQQWGFEELCGVVESRKDWMIENEQAGLPELVLIARVHAMLGTKEFRECPPLHKIPAFHKYSFGELGPDNTLQLLKESQQEIAEIEGLLAV